MNKYYCSILERRFLIAILFVIALIFGGKSVFAAENLFSADSNTISLWRFNDISGSVVADEMGRNNGVAIGSSIVDGKFGKARLFNGINEYVVVPNGDTLNNLSQFTIEAGVNPQGFDLSAWANGESLVAKGIHDAWGNYLELMLIRNQDDNFGTARSFNKVMFMGDAYSARNVISPWYVPDQWYYVALSYDGLNMNLYVNGDLVSSFTSPGLVINNSDPLYINHHTWANGSQSSQRMQGLIDEVRISNIARSAQEIANNYNLANGIHLPPAISLLQQFKNDGVMSLSEGSVMPQNAVILGATANSSSTNPLQLQIQLSTSSAFASFMTATSTFVSSGIIATTSFSNLVDGQYYWRAKVVDGAGLESAWQEFGVAGVSDFTVKMLEPIVIIPGVMGSQLTQVSDGIEAWPNILKMVVPGADTYLDALKLTTLGQQIPGQEMRVGDILKRVTSLFPIYGPLIDSFVSAGYVEGQNLFVAPYDWRMGVASSSESIAPVINNAISHSPNGRVNIIAHSMGGLVIKQYLSQKTDVSFLDKLILAGVPQLGAPKMFKALQYGDDLDFGRGPIKILNASEVKSISQNMPGAYDLLPSRRYVDQIEGSYVLDGRSGGAKTLNYDETSQFMTSNPTDSRNGSILSLADRFHNSIDGNTINAAKIYNLVGCQNPTIKKFAVYDNGVVDIVRGNGDMTVPLVSAMNLANSYDNYFFLNSVNSVDHGGLVSNTESVQFINSLIQNEPLSQRGISTSTQDCFSGFHESSFEVSTHSPVALHAYDSQGRHTGPNVAGDIDLQIPGSSYETIGENSFILLPASDVYSVRANGLSSGAFTLKVKRYDEGVNLLRGTTYVQVPLASASTTATLFVSSSTPDGVLSLDLSGDGVIDNVVQPTAILSQQSASDVTPPVVSIGSPMSTDYLRSKILPIRVIATDTESGVAFTKVNLDGVTFASTTIDLFFQKLGNHELSAAVFDGAGNPASTSTVFRVIATPDSVISDINRAYSLRWIVKKDVKSDLIEKIREAMRVDGDDKESEGRPAKQKEDTHEGKEGREHKEKAGKLLIKLLKDIELKHNKGQINDLGYTLLVEDVKWLINSYASN